MSIDSGGFPGFEFVIRFSRLRAIALFCFVGLSLLYWGGTIQYNKDNYPEMIYIGSILLNGVGGSIVAAAIISLFMLCVQYVYRVKRLGHVKSLLSLRNVEEAFAMDRVVIVVPRFTNGYVKSLVVPRGDGENIQIDPPCKNLEGINYTKYPEHTVKDSREADKECLSFDDVVAVKEITSIFTSLGLKAPKIKFDDEMYTEIFEGNETSNYLAYIAIGLFSNFVTMQFVNCVKNDCRRCFALSTAKEVYQGNRCISICESNRDCIEWMHTSPEKWDDTVYVPMTSSSIGEPSKNDFALLAKVKTPKGNTCLIVGGSRASATQKIAVDFRNNIQAMAEGRHPWAGIKIKDNCFAARYEISEDGDGKPIRKDTYINEE